jgi:hypothetical protein
MRGIITLTKRNFSYAGRIFYVMPVRLLKVGINNLAIGKRLETIVNMLLRNQHRFQNGYITELIYPRRMLGL